jgi:hypothetical protein
MLIHKGISLEPQTSINIKTYTLFWQLYEKYINQYYKPRIADRRKYAVVPYDTIIPSTHRAHKSCATTKRNRVPVDARVIHANTLTEQRDSGVQRFSFLEKWIWHVFLKHNLHLLRLAL